MSFASTPPKLVIVGATGWYGKTFVHEYVLAYGERAAASNLLLYASRASLLTIAVDGCSLELEVHDLRSVTSQILDDYVGLIWYAFILKNRLPVIGLDAYRKANDRIAEQVFACLSANPHLRTAFFSSGAAYGLTECPTYDCDPYAHLKVVYQRHLSGQVPLVTFYPYATLGQYVPDHRSFAAASFIHQAITTGRIVIEAKMPVVRSYGSAHDFSRLLLRLYEQADWNDGRVPASIVPVTHTLDLLQLAHEVSAALGLEIGIVCSVHAGSLPSVYIASDFSYGAQLFRFGVTPTALSQQLLAMSEGAAFLRGAKLDQ